MLTLGKINEAIYIRGIDAVLMRGRGYFYFSGPAVELASSTSVWVYLLNDLTLSQWMAELDRIMSESKMRESKE